MMDKLSKNGELPILLCGDFNTRETDPGYQLATDGYLNDASIKEWVAGFAQQISNLVFVTWW